MSTSGQNRANAAVGTAAAHRPSSTAPRQVASSSRSSGVLRSLESPERRSVSPSAYNLMAGQPLRCQSSPPSYAPPHGSQLRCSSSHAPSPYSRAHHAAGFGASPYDDGDGEAQHQRQREAGGPGRGGGAGAATAQLSAALAKAVAALTQAREEASRSAAQAAQALEELARSERAAAEARASAAAEAERSRQAERRAEQADEEAQAQRVRAAEEMTALRSQAVAAASELQAACLEAVAQRDEAAAALETALDQLGRARAALAASENRSEEPAEQLAHALAQREEMGRRADSAAREAAGLRVQLGEATRQHETGLAALLAARAEMSAEHAAQLQQLKAQLQEALSAARADAGASAERASWAAEKEAMVAMLALEANAAAQAVTRAEESEALVAQLRVQLALADARSGRARGVSGGGELHAQLAGGQPLPAGIAVVAGLDAAEEGLQHALAGFAERARLHERARDGLCATEGALGALAEAMSGLEVTARRLAEQQAAELPAVELAVLSAELRSLESGEGAFEMVARDALDAARAADARARAVARKNRDIELAAAELASEVARLRVQLRLPPSPAESALRAARSRNAAALAGVYGIGGSPPPHWRTQPPLQLYGVSPSSDEVESAEVRALHIRLAQAQANSMTERAKQPNSLSYLLDAAAHEPGSRRAHKAGRPWLPLGDRQPARQPMRTAQDGPVVDAPAMIGQRAEAITLERRERISATAALQSVGAQPSSHSRSREAYQVIRE